jgi:hypothetical protein
VIAELADKPFHQLHLARCVVFGADGLQHLSFLGFGVDLANLVPLRRCLQRHQSCHEYGNASIHEPSWASAIMCQARGVVQWCACWFLRCSPYP